MKPARPEPERWLRERAGPGLTLTTASADASFRRYLRVHDATGTRILMDAPPAHEDCRPFVRIARMLRDAGVHAPLVLAEDVEHGYLLLEDLGDTTYLDALGEGAPPRRLYTDALGALVRMQAIDASALPAYDERLLRFELSLFPDWFLAIHLGIEAPDWLDELDERLVANALAQPQVFVHRDYHSRNLMLMRGSNPGILDFQDAVRGAVTYDLVSLLKDAYVEWPDAQVDEWIAEYRAFAMAARVDCGPDVRTFRRWFDLMGIQRQLKVAGIFARLSHRDGKHGYLADIPRTLGYARAAARRHAEFAHVAAWLDEAVLPALHARGMR
jgi:N-acetylmuramate 1-kinase